MGLKRDIRRYLPVPFYLEHGYLKQRRRANPLDEYDIDFLYGCINREARENIMIGYHLPLVFNNKFYGQDKERLSDLLYGLFKAVRSYDGQRSFPAFARACIRNEAINILRKKRPAQIESFPDKESSFNLEQAIEDKDLSLLLFSLLRKLPEKNLAPLELYLQGYTTKEIQEELRIPKLLEWQRRNRGIELLKNYVRRADPTLLRQ